MQVRLLREFLLSKNMLAVYPWLVLFIYLFPNIFFPFDAQILIHDNLDSTPSLLKLIARSGTMFSSNDTPVQGMMNGIPRGCLLSEYNVVLWLYYFFPAPIAYSINVILFRIAAFLSLRYFIRNQIASLANSQVSAWICLSFALIPVFTYYGLIIAFMPLVLNSFINIYRYKSKTADWLILTLYPLLPNLHQVAIFFLLPAACFPLYYLWKYKKLHLPFIGALALMSALYVLVEYRLFLMYFDESFISHRAGKISSGTGGSLNYKGVLGTSLLNFITGHYQFPPLQLPFIIVTGIIALFITGNSQNRKIILYIFSTILVLSVLYKIMDWKQIGFLKKAFPFLRQFQFRWYALFPLLWYVLFSFSIAEIALKRIKLAGLLLTGQILFSLIGTNDSVENSFKRTFIAGSPEFASFREYYQENLFNKVKQQIPDHDSVNFICIGFEPGVAHYNGLRTLDAYLPFYPLSYKKEFRKIIERELEKNPKKKGYFDNWGNKCYAFLGEIPSGNSIEQLSINTTQLTKMNCKYILSSYSIQNTSELNIELLSEFSGKSNRLKKLYVYKISRKIIE